ALDVHRIAELVVDPSLLDLDFALVVLADDGMLELDLGMEREPLVEAVMDADHEAPEVGLGGTLIALVVVVVELAVAADGRGASLQSGGAGSLLSGGSLRRVFYLGFQFVDFLLQDAQLFVRALRTGLRCYSPGTAQGQCQRRSLHCCSQSGLDYRFGGWLGWQRCRLAGSP